jgi:hypothetical protein
VGQSWEERADWREVRDEEHEICNVNRMKMGRRNEGNGGVSVRAHLVEKRCLENFGLENLRHERALETQTWMGDNIKVVKTE